MSLVVEEKVIKSLLDIEEESSGGTQVDSLSSERSLEWMQKEKGNLVVYGRSRALKRKEWWGREMWWCMC